MSKLSRRMVLQAGSAAAVMAVTLRPLASLAAVNEKVGAALKELGLDSAEMSDKVSIDAPEIAENGNTVPVSVSVDSAMEGDDMVKRIVMYADGNPNPGVGTFHFSEMSGEAAAGTRLRLAGTQNVVAVAEMANGDILMAASEIKVTIGGCGG